MSTVTIPMRGKFASEYSGITLARYTMYHVDIKYVHYLIMHQNIIIKFDLNTNWTLFMKIGTVVSISLESCLRFCTQLLHSLYSACNCQMLIILLFHTHEQ